MPTIIIRHSSEMLQASIDGENPEAAAAAAIVVVLAHYGFDPAGAAAQKLLRELADASRVTGDLDSLV